MGKDEIGGPREVTRRSALQFGAWSVPIIAVAVGTPLAAASAGALAIQMFTPTVDGENFEWAGAVVSNNGPTDAPITWAVDVSPAVATLTGPTTGAITVPSGGAEPVAVGVGGFFVAAGTTYTLTLTITRAGISQSATATFTGDAP